MAVFILLSMLRITALHQFYHAPLDLYPHFQTIPPPKLNTSEWDIKLNQAEFMRRELTVCVGKEWYRFPSHFFLPSGFKIAFVKFGSSGLLPQPFKLSIDQKNEMERLVATDFEMYLQYQRNHERHIHEFIENVNDMNMEEMKSYTDEGKCDYFVDLVGKDDLVKGWTKYKCLDFLDGAKTNQLTRAFYLGEKAWLDYCIFTPS